MEGKKIETIIVTRHPGLVEWLERQGITGEVKASVTADDIRAYDLRVYESRCHLC